MALKKRIWILLSIGLSAAAVSAQGGADRISLDEAVKGAAGDFMGGIPADSKVGVTSFNAPSPALSEYIMDDITKYLVNNRGFIVVERRDLEEARNELNLNMYGEISDETAQGLGRFLGAQIVIFGSIKPLGKDYRMQARALQVETGQLLVVYTATVNGRDIDRIAGAEIRQETQTERDAQKQRAQEEQAAQRIAAAEQKQREQAEKDAEEERNRVAREEAWDAWWAEQGAWWAAKKEYAYRNSFGLGGFVEFGAGGLIGVSWELPRFHWSPFPFTVLGFTGRVRFDSTTKYYDEDLGEYRSDYGISALSFSLGFVFPFNERVKLFGDALLEAYLGNLKGLIADWATPGFDAGISFLFWRWDDGGGLGFEVKYRGTWYENHYIHAIGIGFVGSIGRELSPW